MALTGSTHSVLQYNPTNKELDVISREKRNHLFGVTFPLTVGALLGGHTLRAAGIVKNKWFPALATSGVFMYSLFTMPKRIMDALLVEVPDGYMAQIKRQQQEQQGAQGFHPQAVQPQSHSQPLQTQSGQSQSLFQHTESQGEELTESTPPAFSYRKQRIEHNQLSAGSGEGPVTMPTPPTPSIPTSAFDDDTPSKLSSQQRKKYVRTNQYGDEME